MTHELALKLAKTETPEQMADRIVELYETIEELTNRPTRALWMYDYAIALEEIRNALRNKLKHEELGDEAYDVLDNLWMHYHVTTEDLPEEL
jgi:hypothetical protein